MNDLTRQSQVFIHHNINNEEISHNNSTTFLLVSYAGAGLFT